MKEVITWDTLDCVFIPFQPGFEYIRCDVYQRVFASSETNPDDIIKCFLLFPLQIYFDFSGYVDMALGISIVLGISWEYVERATD